MRKHALEKKVKESIRHELRRIPEVWEFMPVQHMGQGGIPDHIACVPMVIRPEDVGKTVGLFVAVEAKAMVGAVSELQKHQLAGIRNAGGTALVIRGTPKEAGTFNELKEFLNTLRGDQPCKIQ